MLLALVGGKSSPQEACHILTKAPSFLQLANIETAKRQNKLFGALKEGNDAIKQLQKEVTVEQAEQLMADSKEAQDEQVCTMPSQLLSQAVSASSGPSHACQQQLEQLAAGSVVIAVLHALLRVQLSPCCQLVECFAKQEEKSSKEAARVCLELHYWAWRSRGHGSA